MRYIYILIAVVVIVCVTPTLSFAEQYKVCKYANRNEASTYEDCRPVSSGCDYSDDTNSYWRFRWSENYISTFTDINNCYSYLTENLKKDIQGDVSKWTYISNYFPNTHAVKLKPMDDTVLVCGFSDKNNPTIAYWQCRKASEGCSDSDVNYANFKWLTNYAEWLPDTANGLEMTMYPNGEYSVCYNDMLKASFPGMTPQPIAGGKYYSVKWIKGGAATTAPAKEYAVKVCRFETKDNPSIVYWQCREVADDCTQPGSAVDTTYNNFQWLDAVYPTTSHKGYDGLDSCFNAIMKQEFSGFKNEIIADGKYYSIKWTAGEIATTNKPDESTTPKESGKTPVQPATQPAAEWGVCRRAIQENPKIVEWSCKKTTEQCGEWHAEGISSSEACIQHMKQEIDGATWKNDYNIEGYGTAIIRFTYVGAGQGSTTEKPPTVTPAQTTSSATTAVKVCRFENKGDANVVYWQCRKTNAGCAQTSSATDTKFDNFQWLDVYQTNTPYKGYADLDSCWNDIVKQDYAGIEKNVIVTGDYYASEFVFICWIKPGATTQCAKASEAPTQPAAPTTTQSTSPTTTQTTSGKWRICRIANAAGREIKWTCKKVADGCASPGYWIWAEAENEAGCQSVMSNNMNPEYYITYDISGVGTSQITFIKKITGVAIRDVAPGTGKHKLSIIVTPAGASVYVNNVLVVAKDSSGAIYNYLSPGTYLITVEKPDCVGIQRYVTITDNDVSLSYALTCSQGTEAECMPNFGSLDCAGNEHGTCFVCWDVGTDYYGNYRCVKSYEQQGRGAGCDKDCQCLQGLECDIYDKICVPKSTAASQSSTSTQPATSPAIPDEPLSIEFSVTPTTANVGDTITMTVTGIDDDGIESVWANFGNEWHSFGCWGIAPGRCTYTWTTSEKSAGTYYYYGIAYGTDGVTHETKYSDYGYATVTVSDSSGRSNKYTGTTLT